MSEINILEIIKDEIKKIKIKDPLEISRLIYIVLGKLLEYDPTYGNASSKKILELKNQHLDLKNLNKKRIICTNWTDVYLELLTNFGINAYKQSAHHSWVIIELENYCIYADATIGTDNDLTKIKFDGDTTYFYPIHKPKIDDEAKIPYQLIDPQFNKKLLEIDKKIGYKETNLSKQDIFIENLKKKTENIIPLSSKIDAIFSSLDLKNKGIYESNSYIKHILKSILTKEEQENVKGRSLLKYNEDSSVELIQCISIKEDKKYHYYLLKNNCGLIKSNPKEIIKHSLFGYKIDEKPIPGIIFPKKFKILEKNLNIFQKVKIRFQNSLEIKSSRD